jgi:hypothetical protein
MLDIQTSLGPLLDEVTEGFCELIGTNRASEYLRERGIAKYFGTHINVAKEVSIRRVSQALSMEFSYFSRRFLPFCTCAI